MCGLNLKVSRLNINDAFREHACRQSPRKALGDTITCSARPLRSRTFLRQPRSPSLSLQETTWTSGNQVVRQPRLSLVNHILTVTAQSGSKAAAAFGARSALPAGCIPVKRAGTTTPTSILSKRACSIRFPHLTLAMPSLSSPWTSRSMCLHSWISTSASAARAWTRLFTDPLFRMTLLTQYTTTSAERSPWKTRCRTRATRWTSKTRPLCNGMKSSPPILSTNRMEVRSSCPAMPRTFRMLVRALSSFRRTYLMFDCPGPSFYSALRDPKGFYPYSSRQVRLCITILFAHMS
jgi:hypothetical protein